MRCHVLLLGLPGAGKTTVGQLVAQELGTAFVDVDAQIVRREGRPISQLFAELGEAAFRAMECEEVETALQGTPAVVAPGAGWAAQEGALVAALKVAYVVYLETHPKVAAARAEPEGTRPLLVTADPVRQMHELLRVREPFYRRAHATVATDRRTRAEVAAEVVRLARAHAGW